MGALRLLGTIFVVLALASCGDSAPQLVDGSRAAELPAELHDLGDAVLTQTNVTVAKDVDRDELDACGFPPEADATRVVERLGLRGSSITFAGTGSRLYACDKIVDPATALDPDRPYGGVWCGGSVGRLDDGALNDPRLDLCSNTDGDVTAFVWVEPGERTKWVAVSDSGEREVYEVAGSLPVRVTTTDDVEPEGSASFDIEEYSANGSKLREYTLEAAVAG